MNAFVKICGLATEEDVHHTIEAAPDAMGFIFWAKSPRGVTAESVSHWTHNRMPPGIRKVGVFVDSTVHEIEKSAEEAGLDVVQLHGSYTARQIRELTYPVWRVLHVDRLPEDWNDEPVEALLVDSGTVKMPGGTGVRVNTERAIRLIRQSNFPVLLAGGLKQDTVSGVIKDTLPNGVDVSSGVELHPGKKDMNAVQFFIQNARSAFSSLPR